MNILLIDDHPMVIEFYTAFVSEYFSWDKTLTIYVANNCEQAYNLIAINPENHGYDFAYIDYRLPAFEAQDINSGGDIIKLLRKQCQNCKIILITGHTEALLLYDMMLTFYPDGFATKSDVNHKTLQKMTRCVESGAFYKSSTVKGAARKILTNNILIDSTNRKIVKLLLHGHKVKDLHKLVEIKPSTIHLRILKIKKALNISGDTSIVRRLIETGYLAQLY